MVGAGSGVYEDGKRYFCRMLLIGLDLFQRSANAPGLSVSQNVGIPAPFARPTYMSFLFSAWAFSRKKACQDSRDGCAQKLFGLVSVCCRRPPSILSQCAFDVVTKHAVVLFLLPCPGLSLAVHLHSCSPFQLSESTQISSVFHAQKFQPIFIHVAHLCVFPSAPTWSVPQRIAFHSNHGNFPNLHACIKTVCFPCGGSKLTATPFFSGTSAFGTRFGRKGKRT